MVSFFGLKLGSDRKKSQTKAQAQTQTPTSQTWNRNDLNAINEDESFDQNLSPPRFTSSSTRPGTASSMRDNSNWRSVFKNRSMTSSMVDLTAPGPGSGSGSGPGPRRRQPSVSSLRYAASDMNLRSNTTLPTAHGGSGIRPGIPSRPATSNKADWVNPLDVHFCKAPASSLAGTSREPNATAVAALPAQKAKTAPVVRKKLPENLNLGYSEGTNDRTVTRSASVDHARQSNENHVIRNGYPSPPQSDKNSEKAFSPVFSANSDSGASLNKRNPSSSLRRVEIPDKTKFMTSPAASLQQQTSEDRKEGLIVRTSPSRRDTIAFHQPRGRSFTMEFERVPPSTMTHPPKEGFSGNFADFDFGESVTKMTRSTSVQAGKGSIEESARPSASPTCSKKSIPALAEATAPATAADEWPGRPEPLYTAQAGEREESKSPAPTQASDDQVTNSSLIDQLPEPPRESIRRPSILSPTAAGDDRKASQEPMTRPGQGFQSWRFNSEIPSRAPPPRPLQAVTLTASESALGHDSTAKSPCDRPTDHSSNYVEGVQSASRAEIGLPSSPFTRRPLEGAFTVTKGLPRGRLPEPLQTSPAFLALNDEDGDELLPAWSDLGRSAPRQSAVPAPLTPSPARASYGVSPVASPGTWTSPSATAPRIPSPTFPSLADFMSPSDKSFCSTFSFDFDEQLNSPTLGGTTSMARQPSTSAVGSKRRADAKKEVHQTALATMPRSPSEDGWPVIPT
ncbi:hypothetical protein E4U21_006081 [Claviceps maximensis]|nr:hypothetical protein E4U21_006081 [Claviceps maximensis]